MLVAVTIRYLVRNGNIWQLLEEAIKMHGIEEWPQNCKERLRWISLDHRSRVDMNRGIRGKKGV
jgi:hypothetical protein